MYRTIWKCLDRYRIIRARLNSYYYRVLGAHVGAKCLFGRGVRIERPWNVSFGARCVLEPNVWLDLATDAASVTLGSHVFLGRNAHLLVTDGITIGDHCLIGDGVIMSDHKHNHSPEELIETQGCNSAKISIGSDVLICVRAVILQGVTIGDGAIVGPGAIVTQNVAPYTIVGVAPARVVGNRKNTP